MIKDNLKALVRKSKLSQGQIAEQATISEPYLSRLINEDGINPSVEVLGRLSRILGVTIDEIVYGKPEPSPLASYSWATECRIIRIHTTPEVLREIADKIDVKQEDLEPGQELPSESIFYEGDNRKSLEVIIQSI